MNLDSKQTGFDQAASDYLYIAQALSHIGEHWPEKPDLKALAARAGISPTYFHKVFTRWVGLSPRRLAASLTHNEARADLQAGVSLEEVSFAAGLSGPSRLHDLCLKFEALTPGEIKARGAGQTLRWGTAPSPFGIAVCILSTRGLCAMAFCDDTQDADAAFADLSARMPRANYERDDTAAQETIQTIFKGGVLPIALYGTPFQLQVWQALLRIPPGEIASYGQIAAQCGRPKAARAAGAAIGANPISWVIPCHRVLGKDARLTGYHWGVDRKCVMLGLEATQYPGPR